jgi:hypothetical protein
MSHTHTHTHSHTLENLNHVTDPDKCMGLTIRKNQCSLNRRPHHFTCIRHTDAEDIIRSLKNRHCVTGIHYMAHTLAENRVLLRCDGRLYYLDVVTQRVYTDMQSKTPYGRYYQSQVIPYE